MSPSRSGGRGIAPVRMLGVPRPFGDMKLAILSRAPRSYSTHRLRTAAADRGHEVRVLNTLRFAIDLADDEPDLQYRGKPLGDYDAILPRIGASITFFGLAVVRQFEQMDVYTPNTSAGIANARDKLRAIQILSRHGIGIPATTFVRDRADVIPAIERVGGAPVVIKLLEGTQGIGVILAPDTKVAEAVIETLQSARQNVLIQKFIGESRGRDVRALVVGDQVVAAMRRVAKGDEFRSNVHRGGSTEVVELDDEFRDVAVRSAQIMGLRVAGVDMLEGRDGPLVMEVNSSPGLEGIEGATGLDVAGAVVDYIANQVDFPELDVRQRLTVSTGYGVAELLVREGSSLVGKTITEAELREQDITVLTLARGSRVIPNPKPSRELEADDRLLCFGKLEAMRGLVPERRRRRRQRVGPLPAEPIREAESPPTVEPDVH
jgi:ribosomal protein S6--L-glutamate ligase